MISNLKLNAELVNHRDNIPIFTALHYTKLKKTGDYTKLLIVVKKNVEQSFITTYTII